MTETTVTAWRAALGGRRFALLLGSLILLLMVAPLVGDDHRAETDLAVLFSLVVLGFASASGRTGLASALAGIWLLLTWLRPFGDGTSGEIAADAALLVICVVTIEAALRRALTARSVDAEVLCAAISAYVLIGIAWAVAYTMLEALQPGAFALSAEDAGQPWNALLYYSFTTLTTLGYGDVLPTLPVARAWAVVEAITGTLYLAVLIARLVSAYGAKPDPA